MTNPYIPGRMLVGEHAAERHDERSFFDLDGHGWHVVRMDPAAAARGPEAFAASMQDAEAAADPPGCVHAPSSTEYSCHQVPLEARHHRPGRQSGAAFQG